jgi:hypothetical protein
MTHDGSDGNLFFHRTHGKADSIKLRHFEKSATHFRAPFTTKPAFSIPKTSQIIQITEKIAVFDCSNRTKPLKSAPQHQFSPLA